jgi:hypothetical protein
MLLLYHSLMEVSMPILRLLTALTALLIILAQPRDAAAESEHCQWREEVQVFSCNGNPSARQVWCEGLYGEPDPSDEEEGGCHACASSCSGSEGGSYLCYSTTFPCSSS